MGAPGRLKIVVVEDNDDSADMLSSLLELLGHDAAVARDGPSGVSLIKQTVPDVVLCDIGLPGLSGLEVCQEIVRDMPEPPVMVAMTGWASDDDRTLTANAGFRHHLVKPVDPDKLRALLADIGTEAGAGPSP